MYGAGGHARSMRQVPGLGIPTSRDRSHRLLTKSCDVDQDPTHRGLGGTLREAVRP